VSPRTETRQNLVAGSSIGTSSARKSAKQAAALRGFTVLVEMVEVFEFAEAGGAHGAENDIGSLQRLILAVGPDVPVRSLKSTESSSAIKNWGFTRPTPSCRRHPASPGGRDAGLSMTGKAPDGGVLLPDREQD